MKAHFDREQDANRKWDRNVSLLLGAILLVGGGVGAYFFIFDRPPLEATTHAETLAAEKWIRLLLTILWIGFSVLSVLGIIFVSTIIGKTSDFLEKRNLRLKKNLDVLEN